MTVLIDVASRSYNAQVQNMNFNVAADATLIVITMTHPDWPVTDLLVQAEVLWGGVSSGIFTTGGGLIRDKAGVPIGGTMVTTRTCSKPPGFTSGQARIQVMQTLTSAILVESF